MSKFASMPQYIKEAYTKFCMPANRGGNTNAIIAGGAIRDTLNNRWVKDIDIFVDASYAHEFQVQIASWLKVGKGRSKLFDIYGTAIPWQPTKKDKAVTSLSVPYAATQGSSSVYMNNMGGTVTFSSASITAAAGPSEKADYESNNFVVEVYESEATLGGIRCPLNLIFVEVPPTEYVTKYFDYGICKTWYDGSYVHMHGDFTNDVNNKTITMVLPNEHVIACYGSVEAGIKAMGEHGHRIQAKYSDHKIILPSV